MKYYTDPDGENKITQNALISVIFGDDFFNAWCFVTIYIFHYYITNYHLKMMKFQDDNDDTLILGGRGLGKSSVLTQSYIATKILRNPNLRIGVVASNQKKSIQFTTTIKNIFEPGGEIYELLGDLRGDIWNAEQFSLKRNYTYNEGTVNCGSMGGGSFTGGHFNLIILDDAVVQDNCNSQLKRENFLNFMMNTVQPTLIEKQKINREIIKGQIKIIGTHYHPADYYTYLIEKQEANKESRYKVLKMPSLVKNKNGKMVSACSKIKSTKWILREKASMTRDAFNMQYMAKVNKSSSVYFKDSYFQYFYKFTKTDTDVYVYMYKTVYKNGKETRELNKIPVKVYMGVDLAISKTKEADSFALCVIGVDINKNVYLLDLYRNKLSFMEQENIIKKYYNKYPMCLRIGIDATAYQESLASELIRKTDLPISKIKLTKNKEDRISVFSAKWENGKVFLYENNGEDYREDYSLDILIEECKDFPNAKHDDTIDSFCMAWEISQKNNYNDDNNNYENLNDLASAFSLF